MARSSSSHAVGAGGKAGARAAGERPLRVLAMTRLFPNSVEPHAAAFNRQQFVELGRRCDLSLLAVIPWFPAAGVFARWSAAGRLGAVPPSEQIAGQTTLHPRVVYIPKLHAVAPALYAASLWRQVRRYRGQVDVVLGSWAFPDGVAAVMLARRLGVPAVIKLHGSDMNVIAEIPAVRRWLRWALPKADRVVAVSRGLAEKARALGVAPENIALVGNGVDRELFTPRDRAQARAVVAGPAADKWIVYVGRLDRAKGIDELLAAYAQIAATDGDVGLALVGDGPMGAAARAFAARYPGRVVVAGVRPLDEVAQWVAASDVLTLPSWNEGTPNVLLEALASGRRVVSTRVGGIPDVVTTPALGELVAPRDTDALAEALARAVRTPYDPAAVADAAPGGWDDSANRLLTVLGQACAARAVQPAAAAEADVVPVTLS